MPIFREFRPTNGIWVVRLESPTGGGANGGDGVAHSGRTTTSFLRGAKDVACWKERRGG